ncbi:MAG TPA: DsbA family protein [Sphingomonas sp.]|nr:DsbA family protein [Sphingomonas sp.]
MIGIGAAGLAGLALGAAAGAGKEEAGEAATGAMARQYILAHPEIIDDVQDQLRIAPHRRAIETAFSGAWAGNRDADVTLVIFSDYNCPYCRATVPEIERVLAADPKLKVVWREMPVLGPASDSAALAALAAAKQGKYVAFRRALFAGDHPDRNGIAAAARAAGLDLVRFAADRDAPDVTAEVASNLTLAQRLQISGTPFFVIGNHSFTGAAGSDALAAAIAEARRQQG